MKTVDIISDPKMVIITQDNKNYAKQADWPYFIVEQARRAVHCKVTTQLKTQARMGLKT